MNNLLKLSLSVFLFTFLFSCEEEPSNEHSPDLFIEFGFACGWCGGTGNLSIEQGKLSYERIIPCGENKGTVEKSRTLTEVEWNEITTSFDYNYFINLDYSSCNVCVDGCDEIIRISKNDNLHEIRYNPSDNIEGLETLQQLLREYLAEFEMKE